MSLGWYLRPRLVVLNRRTPVLDGARALENNNIGAVVIEDEGRIVGIVTDRDLTVRVVGRALDPRTTTIGEVMTTDIAMLSPSDSRDDAIRLMVERNVRRIPIVEGERLVGMVTLDDLLLDEAAPLDRLAEVVAVQLGEGGPTPPVRPHGRGRGDARAMATYARLLSQVRADAGLESIEQAETALEVVLTSLVRRLMPQEAKDLVAQLPSILHAGLLALSPGPDKLITRETIEAELVQRLDVDPSRAAQLLTAIGAAVARNVSPGQMEDVRGQLPVGLRRIFSSSPSPAAGSPHPRSP